jgi:hypothetical protein
MSHKTYNSKKAWTISQDISREYNTLRNCKRWTKRTRDRTSCWPTTSGSAPVPFEGWLIDSPYFLGQTVDQCPTTSGSAPVPFECWLIDSPFYAGLSWTDCWPTISGSAPVPFECWLIDSPFLCRFELDELLTNYQRVRSNLLACRKQYDSLRKTIDSLQVISYLSPFKVSWNGST